MSRRLHDPIPPLAIANSSLFYVLPLPDHTDRLGRPVVVLTLNQVVRDSEGKLDHMREWLWWALEMARRTLDDWYQRGDWAEAVEPPVNGHGEDSVNSAGRPRGIGGEGSVLLVDATGASYRNLVRSAVLVGFS